MDGNLEFHSVQLNTLPYSDKTKEIVRLQCWLVGRALRLEISFNAELNCMPCYIGGQERAPSTVDGQEEKRAFALLRSHYTLIAVITTFYPRIYSPLVWSFGNIF